MHIQKLSPYPVNLVTIEGNLETGSIRQAVTW